MELIENKRVFIHNKPPSIPKIENVVKKILYLYIIIIFIISPQKAFSISRNIYCTLQL